MCDLRGCTSFSGAYSINVTYSVVCPIRELTISI